MGTRDLGVTYRGSVDAWDCDQMGHLNVRFFGRLFSEAEQHAFAAAGMNPAARPSSETFQFRAELRPGAVVTIRSSLDDAGDPVLTHHLVGEGPEAASTVLVSEFGAAGPGDEEVGVWTESSRGAVRPEDCERGVLGRVGLLRMVNQAGVSAGLERHRERRPDGQLAVGSAIVACSVRRGAAAGPGSLFRVESRFGARGSRSIRLLHRLRGTAPDTLLAACEATVVFFDMATRRAIPLPRTLTEASIA